MYPLSSVIHGESGAGKSWLGDTTPAPRLILDAEGGSRFTNSQKTIWDPMVSAPPSGTDTTIVYIRNFQMMSQTYAWLNSGQHDYNSCVLDSVTELQKRCKDAIKTPGEGMRIQDWGTLLDDMEGLVRGIRDLWMHPIRPLPVTMFITTTKMDDRGTYRPHVQGALNLSLPYFVDVVGYLHTVPEAETGLLRRKLLVSNVPGFIAKDRTNRLGYEVVDPNIEEMINQIYGLTPAQPLVEGAVQNA